MFGIRDVGAAKAWPFAAFENERVINDAVGVRNVVLIGDPKTRTVRAYERRALTFQTSAQPDMLKGEGGDWKAMEEMLLGPNGERLPRVPGHVSYWFAWDGHLGVKSELYLGKNRP